MSLRGHHDTRLAALLDEVVLRLALGEAPQRSASAVSHVRGGTADLTPAPPVAAPRQGAGRITERAEARTWEVTR